MISSKAMGCMLIMGLVGFAVMFLSWSMQGNQEGTTGVVAWAAESNDWENVGLVRMLALFSMLIFMTGFISWARSINDSSSAIAIGSTFALLSIFLLWVSFISHVAGYETASDNTTAALISRGINEIVRLGSVLGAEDSTFYGLAGIGDLSVTAFSKHSRNRSFGIKIGKGENPLDIIKKIEMVVEGYYTAQVVNDIALEYKLEMPISSSVYRILYENLSPKQAIMDLMTRDLTHENN